ncbi:hypothetical protein [Endozoicomonas sp. Mp262]|uniref:hypothetical protein n=1 Tax=Endozoicomonas sp. Mp262 TaxID=2919499 RepID=UPI0021D868DC
MINISSNSDLLAQAKETVNAIKKSPDKSDLKRNSKLALEKGEITKFKGRTLEKLKARIQFIKYIARFDRDSEKGTLSHFLKERLGISLRPVRVADVEKRLSSFIKNAEEQQAISEANRLNDEINIALYGNTLPDEEALEALHDKISNLNDRQTLKNLRGFMVSAQNGYVAEKDRLAEFVRIIDQRLETINQTLGINVSGTRDENNCFYAEVVTLEDPEEREDWQVQFRDKELKSKQENKGRYSYEMVDFKATEALNLNFRVSMT